MNWLVSIFTGGLSELFKVGGKVVTDIHADNTTRQSNENNNGATLAGKVIDGHTSAGNQRADVQKAQGTWGPFGIIGFVLGMIIAFYASQIVLDSTAWHPHLIAKWHVVPWIEWVYHKPGTWKVAALPDRWELAVIEIVKALFYVGPPSTAAVVVAQAFRRT